jgi:hypothetical protein
MAFCSHFKIHERGLKNQSGGMFPMITPCIPSLSNPLSAMQPFCISVHSGTRKWDRFLFYGAAAEARGFGFVFIIISSPSYTLMNFSHVAIFIRFWIEIHSVISAI